MREPREPKPRVRASGPPAPITPENPFGLAERDEVFVLEYTKDWNPTRARDAAGLTHTRVERLLQRPEIRGAIQETLERRARTVRRILDNIRLDSDRVLVEVARVSLADVRKLYDERGALLPVAKWDENTARAVAGVESKELFEMRDVKNEEGDIVSTQVLVGYSHKVRMWDKNKALDMAMKHLGEYKIDNLQRNPLESAETDRLTKVRALLNDLLKKADAEVDNREGK